VEISRDGRQDGPLLSFGNMQGGYGLFIANNRPVYVYNYVGELTHLEGGFDLPDGDVTISFVFEKTGMLKGVGRLHVDGRPAGEVGLDRMLIRLSLAPLRIGHANLPPLTPRMREKSFGGRIRRVVYQLGADRGLVPETLDVD